MPAGILTGEEAPNSESKQIPNPEGKTPIEGFPDPVKGKARPARQNLPSYVSEFFTPPQK